MGTFTVPLEVADHREPSSSKLNLWWTLEPHTRPFRKMFCNVWELRSGKHVLLSWQTTD